MDIHFVLSGKDKEAKLLSDNQKNTLDNLSYSIINLFNSIIDNQKVSETIFMNNYNGNDITGIVLTGLLDWLANKLIPDGSEKMRFDISELPMLQNNSIKIGAYN